MKKLTAILSLVVLILCMSLPAFSYEAKTYAEGRIIVKLRSEKPSQHRRSAPASIGGMGIARTYDFAKPGEKGLRKGGNEAPELSFALITSDTMTTAQMLAAARKDPRVIYAEPDYIIETTSLTNDPGMYHQWTHTNTRRGSDGEAITVNAGAAWDKAKSSADEVVVAVVDTGVNYKNEDLVPVMWDGAAHGFPHHGWRSNAEDDEAFRDPMDRNGHGSHVAGIIAAKADNGTGVAGMSRNTKIIAANVFDGTLSFSSAILDTYQRLCDLKDNGVSIVATNNSWKSQNFSASAGEAMKALESRGVINVLAAANDGRNNDINNETLEDEEYPFLKTGSRTIKVAASDELDRLTPFSNYGIKTVDLAAPGANILSTGKDGSNYNYTSSSNGNVIKYIPALLDVEATGNVLYHNTGNSAEGMKAADTEDGKASLKVNGNEISWTITAEKDGTFDLVLPEKAHLDLYELVEENMDATKVFFLALTEGGPCWLVIERSDTKTEEVFGLIEASYRLWAQQYVTKILGGYNEDPLYKNCKKGTKGILKLRTKVKAGQTKTIRIFGITTYTGDAIWDEDKKPVCGDYYFMSGTSMAAPAVTGSVALLSMLHPEWSPEEVRARIIGGAKKLGKLTDKIKSGGRLDINRALTDPGPVIDEASVKEGVLTLRGWFLGTAGTVTAKDEKGNITTLAVKTHTEKEITAEAPAGKGEYEILLKVSDDKWNRAFIDTTEKDKGDEWENLDRPYADGYVRAQLRRDKEGRYIYLSGTKDSEHKLPYFERYNVNGYFPRPDGLEGPVKWEKLKDLPEEITTMTLKSQYTNGFLMADNKPAAVNFTEETRDGIKRLVLNLAQYEDGKENSDGAWSIKKTDVHQGIQMGLNGESILHTWQRGREIVILMTKGCVCVYNIDTGKAEAEELEALQYLKEDTPCLDYNGTLVVFGGKGENFRAPFFWDGEKTWRGTECPAPEKGEFIWMHTASGVYDGRLWFIGGLINAGKELGNGAYYDLETKEWGTAPTGDGARSDGSIIIGGYLYRTAVHDTELGVTNRFERKDLTGGLTIPVLPAEIDPALAEIGITKKITTKAGVPADAAILEIKGGNIVAEEENAIKLAGKTTGRKAEAVHQLPAFKTVISDKTKLAVVSWIVPGSAFGTEKAGSVVLLKIKSEVEAKAYKYSDGKVIEDGSFIIQDKNHSLAEGISKEENYILTVFIKDNGEYDLDTTEGSIIDPAVIVKAGAIPEPEPAPAGGSGGCNAGFAGIASLALLTLFRKKRI